VSCRGETTPTLQPSIAVIVGAAVVGRSGSGGVGRARRVYPVGRRSIALTRLAARLDRAARRPALLRPAGVPTSVPPTSGISTTAAAAALAQSTGTAAYPTIRDIATRPRSARSARFNDLPSNVLTSPTHVRPSVRSSQLPVGADFRLHRAPIRHRHASVTQSRNVRWTGVALQCCTSDRLCTLHQDAIGHLPPGHMSHPRKLSSNFNSVH